MRSSSSFVAQHRRSIVDLGALGVASLGAVVIAGWLFGLPLMIRVFATSAPMPVTTAAAFLVAGSGLLLVNRQRAIPGTVSGILVIALALAVLIRYLPHLYSQVGTLAVLGNEKPETLPAGRMPLNTALAFLLGGITLLLLSFPDLKLNSRWHLAEICGALVSALGLSALGGYIIGVEAIYGWTLGTHMTGHTAAGFLVYGTALIFAAWGIDKHAATTPLHRVFVPLMIGSVAVILALWQGFVAQEEARISIATANRTNVLKTTFTRRIQDEVQAVARIADRWERNGDNSQQAWEPDALEYLQDYPDLRALGWIDGDFALRWLVQDPGTEAISASSFELSGEHKRILPPPTRPISVTVIPASEILGFDHGFVALYPLQRQDAPDGYLFSVFDMNALSTAMYEMLQGLAFALLRGGSEIIRIAAEPADGNPWLRESTLWIADNEWTLRTWPEARALPPLQSRMPAIFLSSGLVVLALLLLLAKLVNEAERRARSLAYVNSKLKVTQAQLENLALYDELTGLGNRSLFKKQLENLVAMAKRHRQRFGLLIMDLNGFKMVNDTLGHESGDDVLREFSKRLTATLRESDQAFRLGGDEFAVILGLDASQEGLLAVADKIDGTLRQPIVLHGEARVLSASVGAAIYPDHGGTFSELTRKADAAMYEAKANGVSSALASDLGATTVMKSLRESNVR